MWHKISATRPEIVVESVPFHQDRTKLTAAIILGFGTLFLTAMTIGSGLNDGGLIATAILLGFGLMCGFVVVRCVFDAERVVIKPEAKQITRHRSWAGRTYQTETRRMRPGDMEVLVDETQSTVKLDVSSGKHFCVSLEFPDQEPLRIATMRTLDDAEALVKQLREAWSEHFDEELTFLALGSVDE